LPIHYALPKKEDKIIVAAADYLVYEGIVARKLKICSDWRLRGGHGMRAAVGAGLQDAPKAIRQRRGWLSHRGGATAMEFAILAVPFTGFLLFLFEVGFDYYLQDAVDYAALCAARSVQVGRQTAVSAADFKNRYVCPPVAGLLNCNSITVNVMPITPDYHSAAIGVIPITGGVLNTSTYTFTPGSADQLMLLQVIYTSPTFVGQLAPSWSYALAAPASGYAHVTFSSIGFVNERHS
jgi:Flp pilus assembly protein TadG